MKALILNSGVGRRMGHLTSEHPKCMTELLYGETILSRQVKQLATAGIHDIILTTGLFDGVLKEYCRTIEADVAFSFIHNPLYDQTNYIYSIYLARSILNDDIVLLHGDLVFSDNVLFDVLNFAHSCMAVSSSLPLPEKDFKAVLKNGVIRKIGVEFFEQAVAAQPLYKLDYGDWMIWLNQIIALCEKGDTSCYAENAFNLVSNMCRVFPLDVENQLCGEIDTPEDLKVMKKRLMEEE